MFIFNLKIIFQSNFFKMASIWLHFSPGFTKRGGFRAEQFLLRWYSILLCRKIKHRKQAQRDFGGFIESELKSFAVHGQARLIKKCARPNTHMVLCVNRIPPEQRKRFPEVLCVFRIPPEQKPDSLPSGQFPYLRNSEYR
jgi:hypothetical protein